jgi:amino acid transporter
MNHARDNINSNNNTNNSSSSLILTARYGHESSKLIHLIEKNLYIVIGLIIFTAAISIVNALGFHYVFEYSEDIDFIVDISLAVILLAVVIPLIILLLKSKKTLDRWDDMFETNTLSISIGVAMAKRTKEEAFRAIMQSVEQINNL